MPSSLIIDLPAPVAVVCHDAGAANQIVSWLRADGAPGRIRPYMAGPARKIWMEAFAGQDLMPSMSEALAGAASLLSGTGWASDLEHEARRAARRSGMRSAAMVDHWVNYEARFVRGGSKLLPDEIWVVDDYALALAQKAFAGCDVRLKEDAYARQMVAGVRPIAQVHGNRLLYLLEPMRNDWGRHEQGEFQALDYLLARLPDLDLPQDTVVTLRPHPSDPPGKYADYLHGPHAYRIELDEGSLADALSSARWVAGCESFALTLALRAGRTVFCSLPPWAPACRLPHADLIKIAGLNSR